MYFSRICFLASILFCAVTLSRAQAIEVENIPDEILAAVVTGTFADHYDIDGTMNPFYLRADFDGDGKVDYALWIKSKKERDRNRSLADFKKKLCIYWCGDQVCCFRFAEYRPQVLECLAGL